MPRRTRDTDVLLEQLEELAILYIDASFEEDIAQAVVASPKFENAMRLVGVTLRRQIERLVLDALRGRTVRGRDYH